MPEQHDLVADAMVEFALSLPESSEHFPWGQRTIKVKGKAFVFFGMVEGQDTGLRFTLKLPVSADSVAALPFAKPSGYGLGKHGWVTFHWSPDDEPFPAEMTFDWIKESYRAVAPKRLAQLV